MGFVTKEWKDRQSQFPTRRTLTDTSSGTTTTVLVTRSEGTVTQEGDVFDADTMNDLEQRIANGFSSVVASGGIIVRTQFINTQGNQTIFETSTPLIDKQANPQDELKENDIVIIRSLNSAHYNGQQTWQYRYVTRNSDGTTTTSNPISVTKFDASFTDNIEKYDTLIMVYRSSNFYLVAQEREYLEGDGINIADNHTIENVLPVTFVGKCDTQSGSLIMTTDINIERDLQVKDRIVVNFTNNIKSVYQSAGYLAPTTLITYKNGQAVETPLQLEPYVYDAVQSVIYAKGQHIFELEEQGLVKVWSHKAYIATGGTYNAGIGISISNDTITNILPNYGESIADVRKSVFIADGNLGDFSEYKKCSYALIRIDRGAQPDGSGRYQFTTPSNYGINFKHTLYTMSDRLFSTPLSEDSVLLVKIYGSAYIEELEGYKAIITLMSTAQKSMWEEDSEDENKVVFRTTPGTVGMDTVHAVDFARNHVI